MTERWRPVASPAGFRSPWNLGLVAAAFDAATPSSLAGMVACDAVVGSGRRRNPRGRLAPSSGEGAPPGFVAALAARAAV
jgi:hypothetical protein